MSVTAVPIRPLQKGSVLKLWLALILLALVAGGVAWYGTNGLQFQTTESGLQYRVIKEGEGPHPTTSDMALVHFTLKVDGVVLQSTQGQQPAQLPVSGSIPGFSEALLMMSKGGVYRLRIPPVLGYGAEGAGDGAIPPNATLDFEVALLGFIPLAQLQGMMGGMGEAPGGAPAPTQ